MNLFDIIVISVIFLSTIVGFFRGFVYLAIGFASFICSLYSAYILSPFVKPFVLEYIYNDFASRIVSGLVSYLLTIIFFMILSSQVKAIVKDARGGIIDRLFGLMLGAFRGLSISLILFSIIVVVSANAYVGVQNLKEVVEKAGEQEYPQFLTKSLSYPFLSSAINIIGKVVTKDMLGQITIPSRNNIMDDINITPSMDIKIDLNHKQKEEKSSKSENNLESELEELLSK